MRVTEHESWEWIREYCRAQPYKNSYYRLEVRNLNKKQVPLVLQVQVQCIACAATINPFRQRQIRTKDGRITWGGIYISVTCKDNLGCGRGKKSAAEITRIGELLVREQKERVRKSLEKALLSRSKPEQLSLI